MQLKQSSFTFLTLYNSSNVQHFLAVQTTDILPYSTQTAHAMGKTFQL